MGAPTLSRTLGNNVVGVVNSNPPYTTEEKDNGTVTEVDGQQQSG